MLGQSDGGEWPPVINGDGASTKLKLFSVPKKISNYYGNVES
jgi:hypothetical protein